MKSLLRTVVVVTLTCGHAAAQTSAGPVLQALVGTSGGSADTLLDNDPKTTWRPFGNTRDEGILFRFETPQWISGIDIQHCAPTSAPRYSIYLNGGKLSPSLQAKPGALRAYRWGQTAVRSLFIKLHGEKDCLSGVQFYDNDKQPIQVQPPVRVRANVVASSTLRPNNAYHPNYLFDGRLEFGWVEGASGLGIGETIEISFARPVTIRAIELWNGYQRSPSHFRKNARLKQIELSVDGNKFSLSIANKRGAQTIPLAKPVEGKRVILRIVQAFRGTKYKDVVISELRFHAPNGPFSVAPQSEPGRISALQHQAKGSALGRILDQPLHDVCSGATSETTLKLRSNASFVIYTGAKKAKRQSVTDGAWVVTENGATQIKTKMYARKHRIAKTFGPYGTRTKTATAVTGGELRIRPIAAMNPAEIRREVRKIVRLRRKSPCAAPVAKNTIATFLKPNALIISGRVATGVFQPR